MSNDPYSILGIPYGSSSDVVKRAFNQRARELHPDINKDPLAPAKFQAVKEAYDELRNASLVSNDTRFKTRAENFRRMKEEHFRAGSNARSGGAASSQTRGAAALLEAFLHPRFLVLAVPLAALYLFVTLSRDEQSVKSYNNKRVVMAYWNERTRRFEEPLAKHYYSVRLFPVKREQVHPHTPEKEVSSLR